MALMAQVNLKEKSPSLNKVNMSDLCEQLKIEADEVDERIDKLSNFIWEGKTSYKGFYEFVNVIDQRLVAEQFVIMMKYKKVLLKRFDELTVSKL